MADQTKEPTVSDKDSSIINAKSKFIEHVVLFSTWAVVFFVAGYWHAGMLGGLAGAGLGLIVAFICDLNVLHDSPLNVLRHKEYRECTVASMFLLIFAFGMMGLGAWFGNGSGFGTIEGMKLGFTLGMIWASTKLLLVKIDWARFSFVTILFAMSIGIGLIVGGLVGGWGGGAPIGGAMGFLSIFWLNFDPVDLSDKCKTTEEWNRVWHIWSRISYLIFGLTCAGPFLGIPLELSLVALGLSFILAFFYRHNRTGWSYYSVSVMPI
nr:hypothetical protein [Candidatus Sigynarchaeota archaeon]